MSQLQEHYRLLEIPLDASPAHLKQAYKDLVLVWHPDRFSGNPRLQKKAEEKLKCINLAYQQIRAEHRTHQNTNPPQTSKPTKTQHPSDHKNSYRKHSKQKYHRQYQDNHTSRNNYQNKSSKEVSSDIPLQQVQFIVSHFHFRPFKRGTAGQRFFKSGPFQLEINASAQWIRLENLCDSLNGFHPILLAIPCKASATFFGHEGKEVIELFKRSQTQESRS